MMFINTKKKITIKMLIAPVLHLVRIVLSHYLTTINLRLMIFVVPRVRTSYTYGEVKNESIHKRELFAF